MINKKIKKKLRKSELKNKFYTKNGFLSCMRARYRIILINKESKNYFNDYKFKSELKKKLINRRNKAMLRYFKTGNKKTRDKAILSDIRYSMVIEDLYGWCNL